MMGNGGDGKQGGPSLLQDHNREKEEEEGRMPYSISRPCCGRLRMRTHTSFDVCRIRCILFDLVPFLGDYFF